MRYPVIRPALPHLDAIRREIEEIWHSGIVTVGRYVQTFEEAVSETLGVRNAVAVSSCTSGLILALKALGLRGEVILPSYTFAATAHALRWNRLTPVFCDSEPGTRNLDPRRAERLITKRTSAILPVSIYGVPPRVEEFRDLSDRYGVKIVYDSAQALGARVGNRYVGGFGTAEAFSLSPTKVVTAIEGGLVTTDDDRLANGIRRMRDYGKAEDGEDMAFVGLSARMSEPNAVVGLANLRRMGELISRRAALVSVYRERLADLPGIRFQEVPAGVSPSHNYMVIFIDGTGGVDRDELHRRLGEEGIQTKRYFYPAVHRLTAYRRIGNRYAGDLPVAEKASREALALPLFDALDPDAVEFISDAIRSIVRR